MGFTWTNNISAGIVAEYTVLSEIREHTDWLDDNLSCVTHYATHYLTQYAVDDASYYSGHDGTKYTTDLAGHDGVVYSGNLTGNNGGNDAGQETGGYSNVQNSYCMGQVHDRTCRSR